MSPIHRACAIVLLASLLALGCDDDGKSAANERDGGAARDDAGGRARETSDAGSSCADDLDCHNPERSRCVDGGCVQCSSHDDCGGEFCHALRCVECLTDLHCTATFAPVCQMHACVPDAGPDRSDE